MFAGLGAYSPGTLADQEPAHAMVPVSQLTTDKHRVDLGVSIVKISLRIVRMGLVLSLD